MSLLYSAYETNRRNRQSSTIGKRQFRQILIKLLMKLIITFNHNIQGNQSIFQSIFQIISIYLISLNV